MEYYEFLSTPSARRATGNTESRIQGHRHFYPRPPRGGRPGLCMLRPRAPAISIHALREEGDRRAESLNNNYFLFLSTPSARRATRDFALAVVTTSQFLSTPSARRATYIPFRICIIIFYFYPRPPRGGRRQIGGFFIDYNLFLSTPSARRATPKCWPLLHNLNDFYPRPPRGGRPFALSAGVAVLNISIHALREEGDVGIHVAKGLLDISIHALREEGDSGAVMLCQ